MRTLLSDVLAFFLSPVYNHGLNKRKLIKNSNSIYIFITFTKLCIRRLRFHAHTYDTYDTTIYLQTLL